jgi:hypothetical protein
MTLKWQGKGLGLRLKRQNTCIACMRPWFNLQDHTKKGSEKKIKILYLRLIQDEVIYHRVLPHFAFVWNQERHHPSILSQLIP